VVVPILFPTGFYCLFYGVMGVGDLIRYLVPFLPILFVISLSFLTTAYSAIAHFVSTAKKPEKFPMVLHFRSREPQDVRRIGFASGGRRGSKPAN
jgi:hypothetical protein